MNTTPKTLSDTESNKFLCELFNGMPEENRQIKGLRNITMALFMLDAGLRVSEVVGLELTDVVVNSTIVTGIYVRPEIAKGSISRTVPLSPRLKTYLHPYIAIFGVLRAKAQDPFLFYSAKNGKRISIRQVQRIINRAGKNSIGRNVHPHELRHTFATKLMRKCNARIVQQLLGHKHLSSTQIYCHPDMNDLNNAIQNMNGEKP